MSADKVNAVTDYYRPIPQIVTTDSYYRLLVTAIDNTDQYSLLHTDTTVIVRLHYTAQSAVMVVGSIIWYYAILSDIDGAIGWCFFHTFMLKTCLTLYKLVVIYNNSNYIYQKKYFIDIDFTNIM